jgi:hypothetical protein
MIECKSIHWASGNTGLVRRNSPWLESSLNQMIIYLGASFFFFHCPKVYHFLNNFLPRVFY